MRGWAALTLVALLVLAEPAAARPPVLHQVRVPAEGSYTNSIDVGRDGAIWFSLGDGAVRRVGGGGRPEVVVALADRERPTDLVAGPDGNAWLTTPLAIVRVTPGGDVTRFSAGLSPGATPSAIARGPDGNLWFTEYSIHYRSDDPPTPGGIGRITPTGEITEFDELMDDARGYTSIAAGADGAMWFTTDSLEEQGIGRITMSGVVTKYTPELRSNILGGITAGPHGRVWFTDDGVASIGRRGHVRNYRVPLPHHTAVGSMALGPDGALWFAEQNRRRFGRLSASGHFSEPGVRLLKHEQVSDLVSGPGRRIWFVAERGEYNLKPYVGSLRLR
jgi:virginiamycin B lyase